MTPENVAALRATTKGNLANSGRPSQINQKARICQLIVENLISLPADSPRIAPFVDNDISVVNDDYKLHLRFEKDILHFLVSDISGNNFRLPLPTEVQNGRRRQIGQVQLPPAWSKLFDKETHHVVPFIMENRLFVLSEDKSTSETSIAEITPERLEPISFRVKGNSPSNEPWKLLAATEGHNKVIYMTKTVARKLHGSGDRLNEAADTFLYRRISLSSNLAKPAVSDISTAIAVRSEDIISKFIFGDFEGSKFVFYLDSSNGFRSYNLGQTLPDFKLILTTTQFDSSWKRIEQAGLLTQVVEFVPKDEAVTSLKLFTVKLSGQLRVEVSTSKQVKDGRKKATQIQKFYTFDPFKPPTDGVRAQPLENAGTPENAIGKVYGSQSF